MSSGANFLKSIYSRLPQSTSRLEESSGEDEEEILNHARKFQHCQPISMNSFSDVSGSTAIKMGEYQPLGQERGSATVHINGFNNINYDYSHGQKTPGQEEDFVMLRSCQKNSTSSTPASKVDDILRHPMSAMRRVAFVMSILLCIFTIVAFLWVLPCEWASCPAVHTADPPSSWEKTLLGLEIIGAMTVVKNNNDDGSNLLLMVRGEISFPKTGTTVVLDSSTTAVPTRLPANGGGVMTLTGSSGEVAWFKPLKLMPRDIDCSLIDVDADGYKDCLVVGARHLLLAFDAKTGTSLWYVHNHGGSQLPIDMDFPLVLPDMDGDGVPELAVACGLMDASEAVSTDSTSSSSIRSSHNAIVMISGKMGKVLGSPLVVKSCERVQGLNLDRNWLISYTCQDAVAKDSVQTMLLQELFTRVTQRDLYSKRINLKKSKFPEGGLSIPQHRVILSSMSPSSLTKTSSFVVKGRRLTQENRGVCPDHCSVFVKITDERHGRNNETVWSDGGSAMYALAPAILSFSDSPGAVSGFVLKFWHWTTSPASEKDSWARIRRSNSTDNDSSSTTSGPPIVNRSPRNSADTEQYTREPPISVDSRNVTKKSDAPSTHTAYWLTERVVLVTFNATDMHPVNASQSEIQQLCTEAGCQPSLEFQEHSLLITDLDHDGSQEVVSYLTTYAPEKEAERTDQTASLSAPGRLQLVSKIRAVRLEAELPTLYKAFTRV